MPPGDNSDDQKRISDLEVQSRALAELIAEARRVQREVEVHLKTLRRTALVGPLKPKERRSSTPERRRATRRDRRAT